MWSRVKYWHSHIQVLFSMNAFVFISAGEAEAAGKNPSEKKPVRGTNTTGLYYHGLFIIVYVKLCVFSAVGLVRKNVALPLRNYYKWLIPIGMRILCFC